MTCESNINHKELNKFFDYDWYLEQNPDLKNLATSLTVHFLANGWKEGRNPSPYFDMKAYLKEYPEIIDINMNPLHHMAYLVNNVQSSELVFSDDAKAMSQKFCDFEKKKLNRVVVFASLQYGSKIPDYEIYYLEELKKISDAIIYISDSPILPKEFDKLSGIVNYASCLRHEKYDFGSYQLGIEYLKEHVGLENISELVLCNNSCVAPIYDFTNFFETMSAKQVDFWGSSSNQIPIFHLQSYFLVFKNKVINSEEFINFFSNIQKEKSRLSVILKYELRLTDILAKAGFSYDAHVHTLNKEQSQVATYDDVTTHPCNMMSQKNPFVKMTFLLNPKNNFDGLENTLTMIGENNSNLAKLVKKHIGIYTLNKKKWFKQVSGFEVTQSELREKYTQFKNEILQAANKEDEKIKERRAMAREAFVAQESKTVHKYLDGLNGIEIGASAQNPFGLEKNRRLC